MKIQQTNLHVSILLRNKFISTAELSFETERERKRERERERENQLSKYSRTSMARTPLGP